MRTGRCIDQLAGNANFSGCLADTTFQQIADAELTPDLFDIDGPPFVSKARIAGDDEQQPEPRECRSDVVDYAIREIVLLRIGAHNLERQHRDGRPIRKGKRFSVINGQVVRPWWHGATVWNAPHPHRFGDILQRLRTQILKRNIYLATNLPMCIVRNADTARFCDPFETHRNIDPVTKDIVFFDNNITDVNADAKFDPFVLRHIGILFCHAALDFVGTSYGVDHAGEFNESAVPGILDDASAMISDFGIKKRLSKSFQLRQRAFFVDPYQAARVDDIRRQNSRQSPLYVLVAQDPPREWLGEIECSYSTIVGRCPAMPTTEWVIRVTLSVGGRLPVYPDKPTYSDAVDMSQRCHNRKSLPTRSPCRRGRAASAVIRGRSR